MTEYDFSLLIDLPLFQQMESSYWSEKFPLSETCRGVRHHRDHGQHGLSGTWYQLSETRSKLWIRTQWTSIPNAWERSSSARSRQSNDHGTSVPHWGRLSTAEVSPWQLSELHLLRKHKLKVCEGSSDAVQRLMLISLVWELMERFVILPQQHTEHRSGWF